MVLVWFGPMVLVLNRFLCRVGPAVKSCVTPSSLMTWIRSPGCTSGLDGVNLKFLITILTTGPEPPVLPPLPAPPAVDELLPLAVPTEMPSTTAATTAAAPAATAAPPGSAWRSRVSDPDSAPAAGQPATAAYPSTPSVAASSRPATRPAVVRTSLKPNNPIHSDSR